MEQAAGQAAGQSLYIQARINKAKADLRQVQAAVAESRTGSLAKLDRELGEAAAAIGIEAGRICDKASIDAIARAKAGALGAALSLGALTRTRNAQVLCWLGLAMLVFWASALTHTGKVGAAVLFLVAYAALVRWGRERQGMLRSEAERTAIAAFRGLSIGFVAFDDQEGPDPDFPYAATLAPNGDAGPRSIGYRIRKEHGSQFGATFLSFGEPSGTKFLLRLPVDGFAQVALPIGETSETDPAWQVWRGLAGALVPVATRQAPLMRAYQESVEALDAHVATQRLIEQRITTLESLERAWADVALPHETLDRILKLVDLFKSGRQPSPKGMLLYGPPGTGKTLIARKLAKQHGCNFVAVGVADLKSEHVGGTGPRVKEIWERCRKDAPTLLFVDECESVFTARGGVDSDKFGNELVQTFLSEWDGFNQAAGQVFVIGATNRRDLLDTAVMSRFTESIELGPPDADGRKRILGIEFGRARLKLQPDDDMVRETAGMSGRDLHTLVAKALTEHIDGDFTSAEFLAEVRRLRGKSSTTVEALGWDDIVLPPATRAEFESLGRELVHAEDLRKLDIQVPRGILLYGPPGTGKTQVARVLASQSGLSFLAASSSELKASYTGQSGQMVRQLFERARAQAPCILFLDELDTIAGVRGHGDSFTNEIVAQLLQELDGISTKKGQVFLLAATNRPDSIDGALLSRLERTIEIGLPDEAARAAILRLQLQDKPLGFDLDDACASLASRTGGLSGRDLQSLVTRASRVALQRAISEDGDPRKLQLREADFGFASGTHALPA